MEASDSLARILESSRDILKYACRPQFPRMEDRKTAGSCARFWWARISESLYLLASSFGRRDSEDAETGKAEFGFGADQDNHAEKEKPAVARDSSYRRGAGRISALC